ncbi:MAG: hypothetical protein HY559_06010 [Gammaproteobacteria bacterium]|nr:hypothetical protein [Gammaproteobacteria bacterium]
MKAIETTGKVENTHHLVVDDILPFPNASKVRVIVLFTEEEELLESVWLKAASANPVFGDLKDPAEDIYSIKDGKPFHG